MSNKLYVHIVLDQSGSMEITKAATLSAFNEYIQSLKADKTIKTRASLTLFNSLGVKHLYTAVPIEEIKPLDELQYQPNGMTPLNDAIGEAIHLIGRTELKKKEQVALVILTDGLENASKEFSVKQIKEMLENRQQEKDWLVIYLGANQDAWAEGATRGTQMDNTMSFSTENVRQTMAAVSRSTRTYAGGARGQAVAFTDKEREDALK